MAYITIALVFGALAGCGDSASVKPGASNQSVPDLLTKMPNLRPFSVESCSYTLDRSSARSWVPSPSDVKLTLRGSALLSADGFKTLNSRFEWTPIARGDVPKELLSIAPDGDLLFSQKVNESFADNAATYANGFVVIPAGGDSRKIFFLSTNIDHPIE